MAEEAKEGAGPTPEVPPSHSMKTDANEMNFPQATKPKYIDDISLYMAWHNWYLAEQNRFLTSFSMFQFSQNQVLLQQLQQTQTAPRVTTANTVHTAHTTNVEVKLASFKRRLAAEFIDFFFLLFIKLFVISYVFGDQYYSHLQYVLVIDENTTLEDLQMTLVQALLFRVVAIAYEGYCLSGTLPFSNGATVGKRILGLEAIRCGIVEDVDALEDRIRVFPGGPIGVSRSMIRALLKNVILSLFFPMLLPFQVLCSHKRLIYELAADTIVIKKDISIVFFEMLGGN